MSLNRLQSAVSSLANQRVFLYSFFSTGALAGVILNALRKHSNFYSSAVFLSKSNGSVFVMANFGLLITVMVGRLLQNLAFGPLRPAEVERLYDRIWFFVTESLLAFTIFRDEFDFLFILMFGALLFTKCFHWLLSDRIEWMDQRPYPGPPLLFHLRINFLMAVLWLSDFLMFTLAVESILTTGVGGIVLFASEYAILLASLMNSAAKYFISVIEIRRASERGGEDAPPWENKSMYIFYIELATDFLKLVTYLTFFVLVLTFYGLPLNIVRDVYITARSFFMKFRDLLRYRTATRNMDERYPNATPEELSAMNDRTCIICREEMVTPSTAAQTEGGAPEGNETQTQAPVPAAQREGPNTTPKKLPCGHVFHFNCLRSWLERQQNCPTCRRSVMDSAQPTPPQAPNPNPFNNRQEPQIPQLPGGAPQQQGGFQQPNGGVPGLGGIFRRIVDVAGGAPGAAPAPAPGPVNPGFRPAGGPVPPAGGRGVGYPQQPFPPRQPPQGPPAFPGFMLPGGQWQAWGQPVQPDQRQPDGAQTISNGGTNTATSAASADIVRTSPVDTVSSSTTASVTLNPVDSTPTPSSTESMGAPASALDAREARALAALNRANSSSSSSTTRTEDTTRTSNEGPGVNRISATSSKSENRASTSAHASKPHLPPLIPLYDPGTLRVIPRTPIPPAGYRRPGDQTHPHAQQWYPPAGSGAPNRTNNQPNFYPQTVPSYSQNVIPQAVPHMPVGATTQSYGTFPHSQYPNARAGSSGSTASGGRFTSSAVPTLPTEISDEQLARLDRVTREAIDERLKILTSVNNSTHRLIEELLRVRSVLPDLPVPVSTTVIVPPTPESSGNILNNPFSNSLSASSPPDQGATSTSITSESGISTATPSVNEPTQESSTPISELPATEGSSS